MVLEHIGPQQWQLLVENITQAINKKTVHSWIFFLALQKAFDTIVHNILFQKLQKYGFRGIPHSWIENYFTEVSG